ncbi:GNAT family N-acetyltransferase [Nocardioides sp. MAHUQ-72]|uniref:GNAT family N-acetyltransferase n=1 Tax=unclassified Nocardioides TaxID=2615069 RepID=UPI00360C2EA9
MAEIRRATGGQDWTVIAWLWQAYRQDLAPIVGAFPRSDGRYNHAWLDDWAVSEDAAGYLAHEGEAPVAFAVVNRLREGPRGIGAFWVAPVVRRSGLGRRLALDVIGRHPGPWEIAFQDENVGAGRFWRAIADEVFDGWTEEARPVPGKPEVPPDHWISGTTSGG